MMFPLKCKIPIYIPCGYKQYKSNDILNPSSFNLGWMTDLLQCNEFNLEFIEISLTLTHNIFRSFNSLSFYQTQNTALILG